MRLLVLLVGLAAVMLNYAFAPGRYRQYTLQRLAHSCRIDYGTSYFPTLPPHAKYACNAYVRGDETAFEPYVPNADAKADVYFGAALTLLLFAYGLTAMRLLKSDIWLFAAFVALLVLVRLGRWDAWHFYELIDLGTIH